MSTDTVDTIEGTGDLRIQRLEIENYLKIKCLTIDAHGNHILATGPNASGKTALCDAFNAVVTGKPGREDTPEPIHEGEDFARITLDLGVYIIRRKWTANGMTVTLKRADGSEVRRPQELLNSFRAKFSLNPIKFLDTRPQDKVDFVLSVANVPPPMGEILTITGESHEPLVGESAWAYLDRLAADKTGTLYIRRMEVGRIAEQKQAALEEQRRALTAAGGPLTEADQETSATGLLEQIKALEAKDDQRKVITDRATEARGQADAKKAKLDGLLKQREREVESIEAIDAQIAALQAKRGTAVESLAKLDEYINVGRGVVAELAVEADACLEAVKVFPDPRPELTKLRAAVQQTETTNRQLIKRQLESQRFDALHVEAAAAGKERERWDDMLAKVRRLRETILRGVDFGVEGLSVGQGGLRFNGHPFEQASKAEQLTVAFAIVTKQDPKLKVMWVDEGERLDKEHYELMLRLANKAKVELVLTRVAFDQPDLRIEIINADAEANGVPS